MKTKNNYIEILRFLFCCIILIHHSGNLLAEGQKNFFVSGALAVEFFYIVTGYFAAKHLSSSQDVTDKMCYSTLYTVKKLLRVLPYAAFGILSIYALNFFWPADPISLKERLMLLQNMPMELSMLPMTGTISIDLFNYRDTPLWFLSSMLIALPVVMYMYQKFTDVFKGWIMWFLSPILLCYMVHRWDSIFAWGSYGTFLYGGTIRALADITLGFSAYFIVTYIRNKQLKPNAFIKLLITVCEFLLLLFTVYSCHRDLAAYDEIFVTYIIWIMIILTLSGLSYTEHIGSGILSPVATFLGKISMPIYCIHWGTYQYVIKFIPGLTYINGLLINFAVCVLISVILMIIVNMFKKK